MTKLDRLATDIRACRICVENPRGKSLPHEPRPVLRVSRTARLCIAGQAPGTRVHASGTPFTDPSGDRLRDWMGVTPDEFYDVSRIAIVPMGFCFPGLDAKGGDLPPLTTAAASHGLCGYWPRSRIVRNIKGFDKNNITCAASCRRLVKTMVSFLWVFGLIDKKG